MYLLRSFKANFLKKLMLQMAVLYLTGPLKLFGVLNVLPIKLNKLLIKEGFISFTVLKISETIDLNRFISIVQLTDVLQKSFPMFAIKN